MNLRIGLTMKNKIRTVLQIGILITAVVVSTFLCGFFAPRNLLDDCKTIISILLTAFGIALTTFIFLQNVVQNIKNNIIGLKTDKKYKADKFKIIDNIVNELMGDIKWILSAIVVYVLIVLFFMQIDNNVFQEVLRYIQYLLFSIIVFAILDLIFTAFKLIKICSIINLAIVNDDKLKNKEPPQ